MKEPSRRLVLAGLGAGALMAGCDVRALVASGASLVGGASGLKLEPVGAARQLNSRGRGLFADVEVSGQKVFVTYQIAPRNTLVQDKDLYTQIFDRQLGSVTGELRAIDSANAKQMGAGVRTGDLGDHKIARMGGYTYMVAKVPGNAKGAVMKYDASWRLVRDPVFVGDGRFDRTVDMGFATDGRYLYVQFFHQEGGPPTWGARIVKLDADLSVVKQAVVRPESGTFVVGTGLVFVPKGQMGATSDRMQVFSTNRDSANPEPIGIHTFAFRTDDLAIIGGSTRTIVSRQLDVYFPTGPAWNADHQVWTLGYTMEERAGAFPREQTGPSYVTLFDASWNELDTRLLNGGKPAMRVMTDTAGDDVYVVYDEMDLKGRNTTSRALIEHFKLRRLTGPGRASPPRWHSRKPS